MQPLDLQTAVRPGPLARDKVEQQGVIPVDQLPRYASVVESSSPLEALVQYGEDTEGVYINTEVKGTAELLCQFCLNLFKYPFHSRAKFRPVLTLEAAREIHPDEEPVIYENGFVNIINMIEDDAILAIPNYPRCNDCNEGK